MLVEKNAIMLTWMDLFFNDYDDNLQSNDDDDDIINKKDYKPIKLKIEFSTYNNLKKIADENQILFDDLLNYIYLLYTNIYLLNN